MSVDRCPTCAAAVAANAPWCTLCWTKLRPDPEPAPAVVAPVIPTQSAATDPQPASAAVAVEDAPAPVVPSQLTGWPCVRCNIIVPIDDDVCPQCQRRFLDEPLGEQAGLVDRLPNVSGNKQVYAGILVGGSLGLTVVFVVLLALFGLIF